jgi:putative transcriptional regulator
MKNPTIKNNLASIRKEKGLTQEELADKLGISRQSIIAIEKGDCSPSLCHAFKIARFFDMKVEEIFEYLN